ncbi:MAG: hypothetical protein WDN27_01320 [Candidatus Saccharibacteria bacterium]
MGTALLRQRPADCLGLGTALAAGTLYTAARFFHLHTKHHSRKLLIKKHGPDRVRAHLQKRLKTA